MATWVSDTKYYSGQGIVMLSERKANGQPKGFFTVGNVPSLSLKIATSVKDHHESMTGTRGIDARLTTETKCNVTMTLEQFDASNLALASRGVKEVVAAGSVTAEDVLLSFGRVAPLQNVSVTNVVVSQGVTPLTPFTDDETPWDYDTNPESGSIKFNDGLALAFDKLGTSGIAITDTAVGTTTTLTVGAVPSTLEVGGRVVVTGMTGADAAKVNGVMQVVLSTTATTIVTNLVSTGFTLVDTAAKVSCEGDDISVAYDYATQYRIDGMTTGVSEYFLRFEGLNTADGNKPVVIEVFRFQADPFKELALIGEDFQKFDLEGMAMFDSTRTSGSRYFREILV